jgi:hypothetical protein
MIHPLPPGFASGRDQGRLGYRQACSPETPQPVERNHLEVIEDAESSRLRVIEVHTTGSTV